MLIENISIHLRDTFSILLNLGFFQEGYQGCWSPIWLPGIFQFYFFHQSEGWWSLGGRLLHYQRCATKQSSESMKLTDLIPYLSNFIQFFYTFNLFQGIVVSVLYCFMSADVKMALAKRYYRFKVRWQSRNLKSDVNRTTFCMQVRQHTPPKIVSKYKRLC